LPSGGVRLSPYHLLPTTCHLLPTAPPPPAPLPAWRWPAPPDLASAGRAAARSPRPRWPRLRLLLPPPPPHFSPACDVPTLHPARKTPGRSSAPPICDCRNFPRQIRRPPPGARATRPACLPAAPSDLFPLAHVPCGSAIPK